MKTQLQCQLGGNSLENWGRVLQKAIHALNQHLIYVTVSPIARIHGSRDQEVEKGIIPLSITPSDPLGKKFASFPITLSSADLEVWVPEGRVLLPVRNGPSPAPWHAKQRLFTPTSPASSVLALL